MKTAPRFWRYVWLGWLVLFLAFELPAAGCHTEGTLSETTYWFWFPGHSIVIVAAFLVILILHFVDRGKHWWSGGRAILASGVPVALVILWREGMLKKVWGGIKKLGAALFAGKGFIRSNGPWIASALMGLTGVWPAGAKVITIVAGLLNGGQTPGMGEFSKDVAEFVGYLLLTLGSGRKVVSKARTFQPAQ